MTVLVNSFHHTHKAGRDHLVSRILVCTGFEIGPDAVAVAATAHLIITRPKYTQVNLSSVTTGTRLHRPLRELAD